MNENDWVAWCFYPKDKYNIKKQIRIKPCLSKNKEYLFKTKDQYLTLLDHVRC